MLMTGIALKIKPWELICHCIKTWSDETGHIHIEAVGLTGDNTASTK